MTTARAIRGTAAVLCLAGMAMAAQTLSVGERLRRVGGEACQRQPARGGWSASETGVASCLGLGCIADPAAPDSVGRCGLAVAALDCAGYQIHDDGTCGGAPGTHGVPQRVRPMRGLVTSNALLMSDVAGRWPLKPQAMVGGFWQFGLSRSRAVRTADGVWTHVGVPRTLVHVAVHGTAGDRQLVGAEAGAARTVDWPLRVTRVAVFGMGQVHSQGALADDPSLRLGPGVHLEVLHNLVGKAGYLWSVDGPGAAAFVLGLEYGAFLRDDLWLSAD